MGCFACHAFISAISLSWAATTARASFSIAGSLPWASSNLAMSMAPWWCGSIMPTKSRSASPVIGTAAISFDILSIADIIEPSAAVAPGFIGIGAACCARTETTVAIERIETSAADLRKRL